MFKFFADCKTIQEVKRQYKKLVFQFHPDLAGDQALEIMKEINNEYEQAFAWVKDHPYDETEKKRNYYADINDGFREQLEKIIFIPKIEIEICGSWIWVTGETKPVKDIIHDAGYSYAGNKKAWYWKPSDYRASNHKAWDLNKIRDVYGSKKVENKEHVKIDE